ncbi:MAG TPA: hypothetical protein VKA44_05665 [Gemmatimonadota bacterium]|nr:hypothetical protein [Gemmatimonadota bacterium]
MTFEETLEARGLADPRPLYRTMLRELKQADASVYEEAVRRYEEELAPADESRGESALRAWLAYGSWLAGRLAPGGRVTVDRVGRARELAGDEVPEGALLLHVPEKRNRRALALGIPRDPSPAQDATLELLVG